MSNANFRLAAKLINALSIVNNVLIARFCDLVPRERAVIRKDVRITTTRRPSTWRTPPPPPPRPAATTTTEEPEPPEVLPENAENQLQQNVVAPPKRVIRVQHQFALSKNAIWDTQRPPTQTTSGSSSSIRTSSVPPNDSSFITQRTAAPPPPPPARLPQPEAAPAPSAGASLPSPPGVAPESIEELNGGFQRDSRREGTGAEQLMKALMEGMLEAKEQARQVVTRAKASGLPVKNEQEAANAATEREFADRMLKLVSELGVRIFGL